MKRPEKISKLLSANDTGESGGHQAGMLIPKDNGVLPFFPRLDASEYNPRCHLFFVDAAGERWEFAFIYYNNRFFNGTRNEYRLTRMTKYLRQYSLQTGDEVFLTRTPDDDFSISHRRKNQPEITTEGILRLATGWKIIEI
jgi:hypothetical protein